MLSNTQLVRVYVVNGHRTSAGAGPGVFELPAAEASSIAIRKYGRILGPDEDPADLGRTARIAPGVRDAPAEMLRQRDPAAPDVSELRMELGL